MERLTAPARQTLPHLRDGPLRLDSRHADTTHLMASGGQGNCDLQVTLSATVTLQVEDRLEVVVLEKLKRGLGGA